LYVINANLTLLQGCGIYSNTPAQNPCLLEIFFDKALARAKELDEYQETHGRTVGPLHGLPVSLKDQFHVKGVDTCMGYVGWIGTNGGITEPGKKHHIESEITKEFLSVGAVLYCKVC
jgi:amidase